MPDLTRLTEAEKDAYALDPGAFAARLLLPQPEIVEQVAALIPPPRVDLHVQVWPEDEREFSRSGAWRSFDERSQMLDRIRRVKVAYAIIAALGRSVEPVGDGS